MNGQYVILPVNIVNKEKNKVEPVEPDGEVKGTNTCRRSKRESRLSSNLRGYVIPVKKLNIKQGSEEGKGSGLLVE